VLPAHTDAGRDKELFLGYAVSWCAVREEGAEQFLHKLRLRPTGEIEDSPESLISGGRLDTGWRVIWYNKYECPFLGPKDLCALSIEQDVLLCKIEEHVMASSSELWSEGKRKWFLSHEGENGPKGLITVGDLPETLGSIREEMERSQLAEGGDGAGVDHIFEIPLKVAQALVGFKHDELPAHLVDGHFNVLTEIRSPPGGKLGRLFRR
jgi:hypothetical protein